MRKWRNSDPLPLSKNRRVLTNHRLPQVSIMRKRSQPTMPRPMVACHTRTHTTSISSKTTSLMVTTINTIINSTSRKTILRMATYKKNSSSLCNLKKIKLSRDLLLIMPWGWWELIKVLQLCLNRKHRTKNKVCWGTLDSFALTLGHRKSLRGSSSRDSFWGWNTGATIVYSWLVMYFWMSWLVSHRHPFTANSTSARAITQMKIVNC